MPKLKWPNQWNWKTIIYFGFAPTSAALTAIVPIFKSETNAFSIPQFIIIGITIAISTLNLVLTVWSPYKIMEKIKQRRWTYFDGIQLDINKTLNLKDDEQIFFNVMIKNSEHIKEQTGRFPKSIRTDEDFETVWQACPINILLKFKTSQGGYGDAYRKGSFQPYDLQEMRDKNEDIAAAFNMTNEQVNLTRHIKLLFCLPIEFNENSPNRQKKRIIGVVSAEIHTDQGRRNVIENPEQIVYIRSSMKELAKIYTYSLQ
ncbi:MAG TPA: hypothetical protein VK151_08645 [Fluviicola sp.]|nr:hypothetical protein [Fluviicola sp.]